MLGLVEQELTSSKICTWNYGYGHREWNWSHTFIAFEITEIVNDSRAGIKKLSKSFNELAHPLNGLM